MYYAQGDEHQHRTGDDIASEYQGEDRESQQIERLSGKCVQQVARKRADCQGGDGIAGKYRTHSPLGDSELLYQKERKYRHQQVEAEIQQEVRCKYQTVAR